MGTRIPESFIEQLLDRIDIVDVIQRRVPLKSAGREYKACCPFHDEKNPSFTVSPQKQFYHCFGCGAHGSAIGFLMRFEGLEFVDAVEDLARNAGLEMPQLQHSAPPSPAYEPLAVTAHLFHQQLSQHPPAQAYLQQRGLDRQVIDQYQIGYAPSHNNWLGHQLKQQNFSNDILDRAGLINQGRDRFRDRIMFPIHDRRGRIIGFGGRALNDLGPKYLNSPETEVFHKGKELYGLYQARLRKRPPRLIVVEGYMDVIALSQSGLEGAVATLGTATTPFQVERLFQTCSEIVFCFDGDQAGRKAAWRALESTLPHIRAGREANFLFLPEGEDPDTLIRTQGLADFERRVSQALPLSEYFFQHIGADLRMDSIDGRAHLVAAARPYLEKMPDGVFRDLMLTALEERTKHPGLRISNKKVAPKLQKQPKKPHMTPVRRIVAILVQDPALAERIELPDLSGSEPLPGFELLLQLIDFCRARPQITTAQLLEHWRHREHAKALDILATYSIPEQSEIRIRELQDAILAIEYAAVTYKIDQLSQPQPNGNISEATKQTVRELYNRKLELQQQQREAGPK